MFICWLRIFAQVRVTLFSLRVFQRLCDSTIPWNSLVLIGYFPCSASNSYFISTVVHFPLEEKYFTNSIPTQLASSYSRHGAINASGCSCGKQRSLSCILPTQIHLCKIISILGTLKATISIHCIQHNLPFTLYHQQALTVTVDIWLVFKFEQIRANQIFHNCIFGEAVPFRLYVLLDLSWLVYGRCRERIAT